MSTVPATVGDVLAVVPAAGGVGPPSTGTLSVVATPVPPGTTITYQGHTLTAVAVARTSGANNFDGSLGSTAAIAADILAALADPANAWQAIVAAELAGSTISITTIEDGYDSEGALSSSHASITTTGLDGGSTLVDELVALAASMVAVTVWGEKTHSATQYLALHFLAQLDSTIAGGNAPVASVKIADIAKTYAVATPGDALYGSTSWGRMYLALYETVYSGGLTGAHCLGVVG